MKFFLIAQCLLLVNVAFAYLGQQGLDTNSSTVIAQSTFTTLLNHGYSVFLGLYYNGPAVTVTTTYAGIGAGYVANGVTNIVNGRKVFTNSRIVDAIHVPLYMTQYANVQTYYDTTAPFPWPHYNGDNIYAQARYSIDNLNTAVKNAKLTAGIGTTWVVISTNVNSNWTNDQNANQIFFNEFASYFPKITGQWWSLGPQLGVITTPTDFQTIFGSAYQPVDGNGNPIMLMLADCVTPQDSSSYFTTFNGWSAPTIHRYQCGVSNINGTGIVGNLDYR